MNATQYNREIFAERLKSLRKKNGESQEKLSIALGISRPNISLYETGQTTPEIAILASIAEHYGVTTDYLLGLDDSKTQENASIQEKLGLSEEAIEILRLYKINQSDYEYDLKGLSVLLIHNNIHRLLRAIHFYTSSFDLKKEDFNNEAVYRWYTWNNIIDFVPIVENPENNGLKPIEELSHNDVYYYKVTKLFENMLYELSNDKCIKENLVKRVFELYQKRFGRLESIPTFGYLYTYIKNTFSFPIKNYTKLTKGEKIKYASYYHPFDIAKDDIRKEIAKIQQEYIDFLKDNDLSDDVRGVDKFVSYKFSMKNLSMQN